MSTSGGGSCPFEGFNIVRTGFMKKLKTGRLKWFVLRRETPDAQARLEYYDSEKKFKSGGAPRKTIHLKTCFNINQLSDPKHKHVIALYTKDECLTLAVEDESEAEDWFKDLLLLQQGEDLPEGQVPRPTFAHVWEVLLVNRGLGSQDLIGNYRLCLREKTLSLIRRDYEYPQIEINLSSIRSCGSLQKYVFLEVGRSSALGPGELWMETEDQYIAHNVHTTVYHAMTNGTREELGPKSRIRSSSATETSKPNANKKQYSKSHIFPQGITSGGRERCDSMPSRPRTASEGNHPIPMFPSSRSHLTPHRPCSIHRDLGSSPPIGSPISPPSACASTDSAGSSYSLVDENEDLDSNHGRYGHSLTPDEVIAEEDCDSLCAPYGISPCTGNYLPMAPPSSDDGYVEMSPIGVHGNITPAASLSSVTSGTPSTDMRFSEYQLDKVMAFFPNGSSDEDGRPTRAYSVGSRPETYRYKKHLMDIHGTAESRRDRAASVGSKTKKGPFRVLPPHGHYPQARPKSSSAPILSNSRIPGSTSSVGSAMDDLMEIDFSNIKKRSLDGYLDMKAGSKTNNAAAPVSTHSTSSSGYVEMKPGVTPPTVSNSGPYLEMKPGTSPGRMNDCNYMEVNRPLNNRSNNYMDMNATNASKKPISTNNNNYAYGNHQECNENHYYHQPSSIKRSYSQLSPSAGNYFKTTGSPSSDYMDMHCKNRTRTDSDQSNESYVDMSLGKGHHRQSSLDGGQVKRDDYTMSRCSSLKNDKSNKKDNNRSLPIAILNTNQATNNTSIYGRGHSDHSPKMQLPLTNTTSPSSSLPRVRKNSSRRDSRDSSSSSVTTPSNSSTIFPLSLNSPSSPVKPLKTPERTTMGLLLNSLNKRIRGKSNGSQDDYAMMDGQKNTKAMKVSNNDYVNCDLSNNVNRHSMYDESEYAEMQPSRLTGPPDSQAFSLLTLTENSSRGFKPISESRECGPSPPLTCGSTTIPTVSPIYSPKTDENELSRNEVKRSDLPNDSCSSKPVSRPGSASSDLCSSTSTLVGSRPDSVNSDSIRPSSALYYANLDLQTVDDDSESKSPRTTRNNSNDSNQEVSFTYAEIDFNKSVKH